MAWQKACGYNHRALAEAAIGRYKDDRLNTRARRSVQHGSRRRLARPVGKIVACRILPGATPEKKASTTWYVAYRNSC